MSEERKQKIIEAYAEMSEDDLTAGGYPKVSAMEAMTEYTDLTRSEIDGALAETYAAEEAAAGGDDAPEAGPEAEDTPAEDPPAEVPAEDPPAEDPPEEPPAEEPPAEGPPEEDAPADEAPPEEPPADE